MPTATQLEAEPDVESGVWWLDLGGVNAYLADDRGDLVLIDAGTPRDGQAIADGIREAGHRVSEIDRVLVTHYDLDHVGTLSKLGLDAPVYAGRADAEILAGRRKPSARNHKGLLQRVTDPLVSVPDLPIRPVVDGDQIGSFTAYHTPGHSPGHMVYVAESPSVAFLGDLVREEGGTLEASPWVISYDTDEVERSIRRLAHQAPTFEMAAMGHGTPIMRNGGKRLRELAERI